MARWFGSVAVAVLSLISGSSNLSAQGLQILWVDPIQGPICAGPLGPGPCSLVAQWMKDHESFSAAGTPRPTLSPPPPSILPDGLPEVSPLTSTFPVSSVNGAIQCAQLTQQDRQIDVDKFLTCTRGAIVLSRDNMTLVNCAEQSNGNGGILAACAGQVIIGQKLTKDSINLVSCAVNNNHDENKFAGCISRGLIGDRLNYEQRAVLECAANSDLDGGTFASCAGEALFGDRVPPTVREAINCAVESQGDPQQFGGCAATKFLQIDLNPEQQIAIECVVSSGGQPYAAVGCAASRLTARELSKCVENGIGGDDGCFGDNNDLVGKNGFLVRNIAGLAGGPNSLIRDPGQIMGGPNSVFNNPRQILGGPNSVPNQVLKNVPSPPPLEVGKIGKHRVCIPWC